jgi:hypothetical protein
MNIRYNYYEYNQKCVSKILKINFLFSISVLTLGLMHCLKYFEQHALVLHLTHQSTIGFRRPVRVLIKYESL